MRTLFYAAWLGLPLIFFTLALWSKLEELSGMQKKDRPADMMRQGGFVLLCGLIAVAIDYYLLEDLYNSLSPDWIPLGLYRLLLLPVVLLLGAKFAGPTREIKISKAPRPSQYKKK